MRSGYVGDPLRLFSSVICIGACMPELWEWGGRFRLLQTNIGIAPEQIPTIS